MKTVLIENKAEQPEKPRHLLRTLGFFSDFKWRMAVIVIVGIVGAVLYSLMPGYTKKIFDTIEDTLLAGIDPELTYIIKMLVIFGVLAVFNSVFDVFCIFTVLKYENKVTLKVWERVKRKLDVVPASFLEQFTVGDLTRRVAHNTGDMVKGILVQIYKIARASFFYITTSVAMFSINTTLALVVISSLPLCILTARIVSSMTQKKFIAQSTNSGIVSTHVNQRISLHGFFKMNGLESDFAEFDKLNTNFAKAAVGEDTATALNTTYITFINNFMNVLITVVCGVFILNGNLMFGALPTFLTYSSRFLSNAEVVTTSTNTIQVIRGRAARVFEILDCPDDVTEKEHIKIKTIKGEIAFRNVTYIQNNEKFLDDISFVIPKGKSVALVGPTGGGKRSIVELMSKLAIQTEGQIIVDGVNLDEINSRSYYDRMGIAFERPFIFKGTVAENILYGIRRTLPEHVMTVTKRLGSHNFIEQLPQGYETELWENSSLLTVSQKQAINVARTVLQAPDLVIIDEALSAADTITERQVVEEIMKMDKMQTKIFVTHRLSTIQKCDIIMYIENGRIAEQGSHSDLMKKKRKYYKAFLGH